MFILLLINIVVSFSLFLSVMGLIFYLTKALSIRNISDNIYNIVYCSYFLWLFLFYLGNLLGYNWLTLFDQDFSFLFFDIVELIKMVNIVAIITFFFLALALKLESDMEGFNLRIWSILMILGLITIISYLFTDIEILEIENNFPLFGYDPSWVVNFSTLFALITGTWYGLQTVYKYRQNYQEKYGISSYHYLFLTISLIAFIGLIASIGVRMAFPLNSESRALVFAIPMLCLAIFPTLRYTYIQQFHRRKLEFERNTLIDIINHDLSNINHIILAILETAKEKDTALTTEDIEVLLAQIDRMSSLIQKSRTSLRTGPVDRL